MSRRHVSLAPLVMSLVALALFNSFPLDAQESGSVEGYMYIPAPPPLTRWPALLVEEVSLTRRSGLAILAAVEQVSSSTRPGTRFPAIAIWPEPTPPNDYQVPPEPATVELVGTSWSATTGYGGYYEIPQVEPGTYTLRASYPAEGISYDASVTVVAGEVTHGLALPPGVPSEDWDPSWSPDGTQIAFVSNRYGNPEIYVMNADGTGLVNLTYDPSDDSFGPTWSPDGSKIAFTSNRGGDSEIYVMNADGTNQVNLTNNPGTDQYPCWSPDGSKIAFRSNREPNTTGEIYVMDADGTNPVNLTNNWATDEQPCWSPDGSMIAFGSFRAGNEDIWVMNADGTNPVNLTNTPFPVHENFPWWSPDGLMLAFGSWIDGASGADIHVVNSYRTIRVNLTNNPADDARPCWSPDGSKIAFTTNRDGNHEIYIMNPDGTDPVNLTNH